MSNDETLRKLDRMVGRWTTDATHPAMPGVVVHGTLTVEWLEGDTFLIQRSTTDHPDFPHAIAILGFTGAETAGAVKDAARLTMQYFDSRGVHRVYEAAVDAAGLRISIDAGGMAQRITYTFVGDDRIEGRAKMREGDQTWRDDLAIDCRRA